MGTNTLTTELEAVNFALLAIGEAPVNSLTGVEALSEAGLAKTKLGNVCRRILTQGWHFNTDYEFPLQPTGANEILVPATVLAITTSRIEGAIYDVAVRAGKIWDRREKTFTGFTREVKFDITWSFPFDELPEYARELIGVAAAVEFQQDVVGSDKLDKFIRIRFSNANISFKQAESRAAGRNILSTGVAARTTQR